MSMIIPRYLIEFDQLIDSPLIFSFRIKAECLLEKIIAEVFDAFIDFLRWWYQG